MLCPAVEKRSAAFTLVEMLVSIAILVIIIGIVFQITTQTSQLWRSSTARMQSFQAARAGFEGMTRKIAQATLNTYNDYYDSSNNARSTVATASLPSFVPATYSRYSDLHFIAGQAATLLKNSPTTITTQTQAVFFQAPLGYAVVSGDQGLASALNACGYFLQFDSDAATVPSLIKITPGYQPRYRMRLMEMMQSTETLGIYYDPSLSPLPGANDWFVNNAATNSRVLAENVIALIILPKLSNGQDDPNNSIGHGVTLAPNYNYNSRIGLNATTDTTWASASPAFPGDSFTAYPLSGGTTTASRHAQLPPLLQVVMIVIDEPSAIRLQGTKTTLPAGINLSTTGLFTDATKLSADIQSVVDICNAKSGNLTGNTVRLNYQIFNSDVIMRDSKWSNK